MQIIERATLIVAATGRFQSPIHQGHVEYITAARLIASEQGAPFVILTGPLDVELLEHERIVFAQRRRMLSDAMNLSEEYILNHGGSPRGGNAAVARWATGFFEPIRSISILDTPAVDLVIVRKPDDIKDYGFGDKCHYSDLLAKFASGIRLCIRDVTEQMSRLDLSTRHLRAGAPLSTP